MLKSMYLENFKCFEHQDFELGHLTLLTGLNGTGKSSVIQPLLLLRQSYQRRFLQDGGLLLDGDLIQLGTAQDVIFEGAGPDETFGFHLGFGAMSATWHFQYERQADVTQLISGKVCEAVYDSSLFGDNFYYLPADRIGPQPTFETSNYAVNTRKQLGGKGQYAPHFLKVYGKQVHLIDNRRYPDKTIPSNLGNQVDAWLGEISPGIRINLDNYYPEIGQIDLRYSFLAGELRTQPFRSSNVGFGITYTLPIILALLASEKDTLVLLENPEAHLHPRGQFQLGELMARAASYGVQILVESHSDHILNGIRVAVRQGIISPDSVNLHYLSRPKETRQLSAKVDSPRIDEDGRIDEWPEGFFDEWEKSLAQLF